jgi:neutral/alkaline ceramidase-like enzyme
VRAGFGAASITPAPPVWLAGFGDRSEPAPTVHDELEARAVWLDDGGVQLCLVVCDLLGVSAAFSYPVREAMGAELGLPLQNVLIACTHTHHGPSVIAGSERLGWITPDDYADVLRDGCVAAARTAKSNAQNATLRYARAPLPAGFSFNRRGSAYNDPWFALLDVHDHSDARIGVIANLSIHPVLLGPHWLEVSTDWVAPFRGELERVAGGSAIELTGSLGDINPTPPAGQPDDTYAPWASWEQTESFGKQLATAVASALDDAEVIDGSLQVVRSETKDIPVGETGLAMLLGEPSLRVEFVEWDIGGVRLVSMPGEAFHLLGKEISAARDDRVLLAGLSPTWNGYLPHPWGEGYEEGVSFGEPFVAAIRTVLVQAP